VAGFEKMVFLRGFAAFAMRLQALDKQRRFLATQMSAAACPPDAATGSDHCP